MFWKSFPGTSNIYFPPPPLTMLMFFDRTNFWNTEIVIFNIDMGEGGRTVYLSQRNTKIMYFQKIFAHDCSDAISLTVIQEYIDVRGIWAQCHTDMIPMDEFFCYLFSFLKKDISYPNIVCIVQGHGSITLDIAYRYSLEYTVTNAKSNIKH